MTTILEIMPVKMPTLNTYNILTNDIYDMYI